VLGIKKVSVLKLKIVFKKVLKIKKIATANSKLVLIMSYGEEKPETFELASREELNSLRVPTHEIHNSLIFFFTEERIYK
jgi:hypothetical protein